MAGFLDTSWLFDENIYKNRYVKYATKYGAIVAFILYFIMFFNLSRKDDYMLDGKNLALYLTGIFAPIIVFCYFIFTSVEDKKYLGLLIVMIIIILIVLLRSLLPSFDNFLKDFASFLTDVTPLPPLNDEYSFIVLISLKLLLIFMVFVGLSIVYNVFLNEGYRQDGSLGFLIYIIFYIPCLISDYLKYLFTELTTTPRVVYALILLEICLILLYIYIPRLFSKIVLGKGKQLVVNPTYFYYKKNISNIEPFYDEEIKNKKIGMEITEDKQILREYCISMWMTTNAPIGSTEECMMFRFANEFRDNDDDPDSPKNGCPYMSCTKEGKWRFVVSNGIYDMSNNGDFMEDENNRFIVCYDKEKRVTTDLDVPMQRWNQVVINYHDNKVDIFINGVLRETISLANDVLPFYNEDMHVTIGSNTNELHGAVCNLVVYPHNLNLTQITQSYNILKLKNPPINNLS